MAVRITHIRLAGAPKLHESITHYRWENSADGKTGSSDKATMVAWVGDGNSAHVGSGANRATVGVVRPDNGQPYLRTYADGKWNNNLLSLPEY